MIVTVADTWPHHCVVCTVPLHWSRSVAAGACCCCRGDHAPDERVDATVDVTDWAATA